MGPTRSILVPHGKNLPAYDMKIWKFLVKPVKTIRAWTTTLTKIAKSGFSKAENSQPLIDR